MLPFTAQASIQFADDATLEKLTKTFYSAEVEQQAVKLVCLIFPHSFCFFVLGLMQIFHIETCSSVRLCGRTFLHIFGIFGTDFVVPTVILKLYCYGH